VIEKHWYYDLDSSKIKKQNEIRIFYPDTKYEIVLKPSDFFDYILRAPNDHKLIDGRFFCRSENGKVIIFFIQFKKKLKIHKLFIKSQTLHPKIGMMNLLKHQMNIIMMVNIYLLEFL